MVFDTVMSHCCYTVLFSLGFSLTLAALAFVYVLNQFHVASKGGPNRHASSTPYMKCGMAPLCGVLALQSGQAEFGPYSRGYPSVHGLWPQDGWYGDSECLPPLNNTILKPAAIVPHVSCNQIMDSSRKFLLHEWKKHGTCAGMSDVNDYLSQTCLLASGPVREMSEYRDYRSMIDVLKRKGYPVYSEMTRTKEVLLSVCAARDGRWQFADPEMFDYLCGGTLGYIIGWQRVVLMLAPFAGLCFAIGVVGLAGGEKGPLVGMRTVCRLLALWRQDVRDLVSGKDAQRERSSERRLAEIEL